ncbi:MAG: exo-alpha-sialidase [Ktedonobacteraceae bacterium]|nr:exo-alpha-sialidase [Ktedonobacteraceae bacterium]
MALLSIVLLLLAACDSSGAPTPGSNANPTPPGQRVNGFGTTANHPHDMLIFPNKTMILATHYGLFRSADNGATWSMVAAGPGQLMDGLMTDSLSSSPLNPQRLYVLTYPALPGARGTLGLYRSDDQGQTWKMAIAASQLTADQNIFLETAGNGSPDEVYVYVSSLGAQGLLVSKDGGEHFSKTSPLPFGRLTSLLVLPGKPHHLLAGSTDGMARSTDGGQHWEKVQGVTGAVFGHIVTAGPGKPLYVAGDAGIYASTDEGKSFTVVNTQAAYGSLTVSPKDPQTIYGRTAQGVFRSTDGGKTWSTLPKIKGNLYNLVADPENAPQVYLTMQYPTELYRFDSASNTWLSLTPKL